MTVFLNGMLLNYDKDGYFIEYMDMKGKHRCRFFDTAGEAETETTYMLRRRRANAVHFGAWDAETQEAFNSCTLTRSKG